MIYSYTEDQRKHVCSLSPLPDAQKYEAGRIPHLASLLVTVPWPISILSSYSNTQGLYLCTRSNYNSYRDTPIPQQQDFLANRASNPRTSTHINSKWCRTVEMSKGRAAEAPTPSLRLCVLSAQPAAATRGAWLDNMEWTGSGREMAWQGPPWDACVHGICVMI